MPLLLEKPEDEHEIIFINIFLFVKQISCLGLRSELLLLILAESTICLHWQPGETVKQSPSTSPISQHWCSDLGSHVHSGCQESASTLGNALCLGTCLLAGSS